MATPTNLPVAEVAYTTLAASWLNDLRGAFRILQVVDASYATQVSSTTTTYADTGLTASITPQSTTSKILVVVSQNVYTAGSATGAGIQIVRNLPSANTVLQTNVDICYGNNSGMLMNASFIYMDSPTTTSALTYKTRFNRGIGGSTVFVQANGATNPSTMILCEVSA